MFKHHERPIAFRIPTAPLAVQFRPLDVDLDNRELPVSGDQVVEAGGLTTISCTSSSRGYFASPMPL